MVLTLAIWGARILLSALFFYAGFIKAGASEAFATTIAGFSILPEVLVGIFALTLPWIEIAAAALVIIPRTSRIGADLISLLLCVFIGAIVWALSQGMVVDCGCFGEGAPTVGKMVETLVRDAVLLVLSVGLARRNLPKAN